MASNVYHPLVSNLYYSPTYTTGSVFLFLVIIGAVFCSANTLLWPLANTKLHCFDNLPILKPFSSIYLDELISNFY